MGDSRCLSGANWGTLTFEGENLVIKNGKKRMLIKLQLPLLNNSMVCKSDVVIDLNSANLRDDEDSICEMRLFIPTIGTENSFTIDDDEDGNNQPSWESHAEKLHLDIMARAKIGNFSGQPIIKFQDVTHLVPTGKFSIDMHKKSVRFRGSIFSYSVEYSNVIKGFLLSLPDDVNLAFVLGLEQPIKVGNDLHTFVVMQFKKDQRSLVRSNINPNEKKDEILKGIEEEYSGPLFEIVGQVFKAFCSNVQIIMPSGFQSSDQLSCLKCSLKNNQGFLYPLKTCIIFVFKPVVHILIGEIQKVEFNLVQGNRSINKHIDVKIFTKTKVSEFSGIEHQELEIFFEYFNSKNVNVVVQTIKVNMDGLDEEIQLSQSLSEEEQNIKDQSAPKQNRRITRSYSKKSKKGKSLRNYRQKEDYLDDEEEDEEEEDKESEEEDELSSEDEEQESKFNQNDSEGDSDGWGRM